MVKMTTPFYGIFARAREFIIIHCPLKYGHPYFNDLILAKVLKKSRI
jgi:hypothetical protein